MLRVFNAREGMSAKEDTLPERIFKPLIGGITEGNRIDRGEFEAAKKQYYEIMGWNAATGNHSDET